MTLAELLNGIPVAYSNTCLDSYAGRLRIDSREVRSGDTFVAQEGMTVDGHCFAAKAVQNGASLVLAQKKLDDDIPQIVFAEPYPTLSVLASRYYGYPSKKLKMIGVTGTNGKTTVTHILHELLTGLGHKAGLIGTNRVLIGDIEQPSERTTPDAQHLQETLYKMVKAGCEYCVMEVSSHALDLGRVEGIHYDAAAFTNLTQDHLDYHKTMEEYFNAKRRLFDQCGTAVINTGDPYGERLAGEVNVPCADFGTATEIELNADSVRFKAAIGGDSAHITCRMPGSFSVKNALTALSCGKVLGFTLDQMSKTLETIPPVKGRMELVEYKDGITVYIDYAHSPDALENVLKAAREFTSGRLICLFGCGGNRDEDKRPKMGEIATRLADLTVVTSDNPRFEKPDNIINDILDGCKGEYFAITDRRDAIEWALKNAQSGDVVMLCGKGHETYQEIDGQKNHMDEREIVACLTH